MIKYKILLIILIFTLLSFSGRINSVLSTGDMNRIRSNTNYQVQNPPGPENGKDIYMKHCLTCHQLDGGGVPGMFPPIQGSDWVIGDKARIISVVLNGLQGEIAVNDEIYVRQMPKQDYLTDEQVAKVLTFIRQNFGNKASVVKPIEVTKVRPKKVN